MSFVTTQTRFFLIIAAKEKGFVEPPFYAWNIGGGGDLKLGDGKLLEKTIRHRRIQYFRCGRWPHATGSIHNT
jgi:hypothetical protein